jgi:dihydroorotate dehydrogenase (NAD+) catalytic subunit
MFLIDGKSFYNIMNASGCRSRYKEQLDQLVANGMKTIITKTCTLNENIGNSEPNFRELNDHISINCLGMPNSGFEYYRDLLPLYYKAGITYIISMDASNWNDLRKMLLEYDEYIYKMKYDLGVEDNIREFVEINVSCPNKLDVETGTTSRIIAYDPRELTRLLENIKNLELVNLNIVIKLSPYVDKILLEQIAKILISYSSIVKYIVCGNSIPNGMIMNLKSGEPLLSVKTGGISSTANRLLGVSNVYHFNKIFNSHSKTISIVIIGCGGIETADDIREYFMAGVKGVQIGRVLYIDGIERVIDIKDKFISKL